MDPLVDLLDQPLRLSYALDLHSLIKLLEDATRAFHAELERRDRHGEALGAARVLERELVRDVVCARGGTA